VASKTSKEQRRAFPRYSYGQELQVKSDAGVWSVTGIDLALGGVRVSADKELPQGANLRLYLPLRRADRKGSKFCAVSGNVAWQHGPAAGIRFHDVDEETANQLAAFLITLPHAPTTWADIVLEAPEPFAELRLDDKK
jgi:hypothetical protein